MKRYVVCFVLLLCNNLNFGAENRKKEFANKHALTVTVHGSDDQKIPTDPLAGQRTVINRDAKKNKKNGCCGIALNKVLIAGALVTIYLAWPTEEDAINYIAASVDCAKIPYPDCRDRQTCTRDYCMYNAVCESDTRKNLNGHLTEAQQAEIQRCYAIPNAASSSRVFKWLYALPILTWLMNR